VKNDVCRATQSAASGGGNNNAKRAATAHYSRFDDRSSPPLPPQQQLRRPQLHGGSTRSTQRPAQRSQSHRSLRACYDSTLLFPAPSRSRARRRRALRNRLPPHSLSTASRRCSASEAAPHAPRSMHSRLRRHPYASRLRRVRSRGAAHHHRLSPPLRRVSLLSRSARDRDRVRSRGGGEKMMERGSARRRDALPPPPRQVPSTRRSRCPLRT
jgi:hypothetical protein